MKVKHRSYYKSLTEMLKTIDMLGYPCCKPQAAFLQIHFQKLVKAYGERIAVKQLAAYYAESLRFTLGLEVVKRTPIWMKRHKGSNFPILLYKHFGTLLKSPSEDDQRAALSLLRCYESIFLTPEPNLGTICDPSTGNLNFQRIRPSFDKFLRTSIFMQDLRFSFEGFRAKRAKHNKARGPCLHYTGKSGISGPSLITAGAQSRAIRDNLKDDLIKFSEQFELSDYKEILESNQSYHPDGSSDLFSESTERLKELNTNVGKVLFLPAKGGKTRLVAVGNYWIQEALIQLHRVEYETLRNLKCDGTYAQESAFKRVLEASARTGVWSFDLTAATDRFPIDPQTAVLRHLNTEVGDLWDKILKSLTFVYEGIPLKYAVGQPMGLYSSWATFTLSHHVIIQYAAWKAGAKHPFQDYAVLGDDVAIWHERTAKEYRYLMVEVFQVSISEAKSFVPEFPNKPCIAEFAKRISKYGKEFTPISPEQSRSAWNSVSEFPMFLEWLQSRNYDIASAPVSKIAQIGGLKPFQFELLVMSIHLWSLLKQTVLTDLTEYRTSIIENVDRDFIYERRLDLLGEQTIALEDWKPNLRNANGENLEKILGGPVPKYHYFDLALETRLKEVIDLKERLTAFLTGVFWDPSTQPSAPLLEEFEFVPYIEVYDSIKGFTRNKSKRTYIGEFITKLAKESLAERKG